MELKFLEMTGYKSVKYNQKFYQILGFDIMFDDDLNAWLFEVNSYPSMDIYHHSDRSDGLFIREESKIDQKIKSKIFTEAARILIAKDESSVFELVYDSEEDSGLGDIYEGVCQIYKKLSGIRIGTSISSSKFANLAKYLPKKLGVTKIDLELKYKKLQHEEKNLIGLIEFFTAMKDLADNENGGDLLDLVNKVLSKIDQK